MSLRRAVGTWGVGGDDHRRPRRVIGGENPSLSATDFRKRKSPSKSGASRTAGFWRWSTTVEHRGELILAFLGGICEPNKSPVGALRRRLWISASAIDGGQRVPTPKARAVETLGTPQGSPAFHRFSSGRDCGSSGHERRSRKFSRRGTRAMAENRLIIELTYSNRGDGDWSHQIDIFRQIEIERLAAEEERHSKLRSYAFSISG
jgi:hypothetical protein